MPDGKYTDDPVSGALTGTEKIPNEQSGLDKHLTPNLLKTFIIGALTPTELSYLVGVTSAVQTQIDTINAVLAGMAGFSFKEACRAATTANITLSGTQTIDGVSVIAGQRVLVKDQTTKIDNGIYLCQAGAWTRSLDFDGAQDKLTGAVVAVKEGDQNSDELFVCSNDTLTIGSDNIVFEQFSDAQVKAVAATYTTTKADTNKSIFATGTFTITLRSAAGITGHKQIIKNVGAGVITIDTTGAETIDGGGTEVLSTQYDTITVQSDGTNWFILSRI